MSPDPERRFYDAHHSGRRSSFGRRRSDCDPRTTISRKLLVIVVAIINGLYLVGEALLTSGHC
jgi:hypothetical protein